jgi:hypothetical protein
MGMKEELVRTDEENEQYRQLVESNRLRRKQLLQKQYRENQSIIPQVCSFVFTSLNIYLVK